MQRRALGFFFISLALALFGESIWILAKAQLAQLLLTRAWEQRVSGAAVPKPWPWADTWPVALLRAPRLGADHIVLAGASGRNMAFGPTHIGSSDVLGGASNAVVSGHRDTHFAFLEYLTPGDVLVIDTPDAKRHRYRVKTMHVVDERDVWVLEPTDEKMLTLVTCFPFDAVVHGGPARYVTVKESGRRLGFITPLTHNFCESCNRVRVTCTGTLYMCLGQEDAADLRAPRRASSGNGPLADAIREAIGRKPKGHDFIIDRRHTKPAVQRHMSVTGG